MDLDIMEWDLRKSINLDQTAPEAAFDQCLHYFRFHLYLVHTLIWTKVEFYVTIYNLINALF